MKTSLLSLFSLLTLVGLSGCIKGEKLNIEVDILSVTSPNNDILNVTFSSGLIDVYAVPGTDLETMRLNFALSEGASIEPNPEEITDYSTSKKFIVTSEDGEWKKPYTINVRFSDLPTRFLFEHWRQPERMRYRIPYETAENVEGTASLNIWACGNEPYNFLTGKDDDYTAFPTQPTSEAAEGETAAKLITKYTGQFDRLIAAGSLFIGTFDASLREPLESTQFGLPFMKKPLRFKGRYKYRSGGETLVSHNPDHCKIHAVLYSTENGVSHLNGFTIKDSPNVVARAELPETALGDTPGEGFASFDIEFVYTKEIDSERLRNGGYNLTVIFSSSLHGDVYDGAEGSTLIVDDIEIVCEEQPTGNE